MQSDKCVLLMVNGMAYASSSSNMDLENSTQREKLISLYRLRVDCLSIENAIQL